jgi:hypothetical protein
MAENHREAAALATAAIYDLISKGQALQAAVIRGASEAEQTQLRQEAQMIVDAYLDHMAEAAAHVRAIANP